jgi:hypothetical protein
MASPLRTLGWAAYLGVSWTWCIGMFLPILLMRDFGWWAFPVFAIPNVVGAAAMGWVLRDRGQARRVAEAHRSASFVFSLVTVSFQVFFLVWLLLSAGEGWLSPMMMVVIGAGIAASLLLVKRGVPELVGSVLVWLLSLGIGVFLLSRGGLHNGLAMPPVLPVVSLVWLAPVCLFGFALCPYLDATFLRAAREAPSSPGAFALGFGVCFFTMILLTLGYARLLLPMAGAESEWRAVRFADVVRVHIIVQIAFTILAHLLCWVSSPGSSGSSERSSAERHWFGVDSLVAAVAVLLPLAALATPSIAGLSGYEVAYRLFMTFYGLIFPAYVWVCMIPTRDGHSGVKGERGGRKLVVLLAAVAVASPCYWMGFIERETWWLAPGLGVVLMARVVVMGRRAVGEVSARGGM